VGSFGIEVSEVGDAGLLDCSKPGVGIKELLADRSALE
jgi:hypothetical protein